MTEAKKSTQPEVEAQLEAAKAAAQNPEAEKPKALNPVQREHPKMVGKMTPEETRKIAEATSDANRRQGLKRG